MDTPDQSCARDGLASTECATAPLPSEREILSAKTCARLFPHEEVLQSACESSCRSSHGGDGQDCAFAYSRATHDFGFDKPASHGPVWGIVLIVAIVCACGWRIADFRRKTRGRHDLDRRIQ